MIYSTTNPQGLWFGFFPLLHPLTLTPRAERVVFSLTEHAHGIQPFSQGVTRPFHRSLPPPPPSIPFVIWVGGCGCRDRYPKFLTFLLFNISHCCFAPFPPRTLPDLAQSQLPGVANLKQTSRSFSGSSRRSSRCSSSGVQRARAWAWAWAVFCG